MAGSTCPPLLTPVIIEGEGAGEDILCYPDLVCFGPPVATPGLSFIDSAVAFTGASSAGMPANENGKMTASVRYPESGTLCMSGDDGAGLSLRFAPFWDDETGPSRRPTTDSTPQAGDLGITALSFTLETPPSTGVTHSVITFDSCGGPTGGGEAAQDGNPVVITSSGTTTFSFAMHFPPFDANALGALWFVPGAGAYDFCITDLKFLDANGNEITP